MISFDVGDTILMKYRGGSYEGQRVFRVDKIEGGHVRGLDLTNDGYRTFLASGIELIRKVAEAPYSVVSPDDFLVDFSSYDPDQVVAAFMALNPDVVYGRFDEDAEVIVIRRFAQPRVLVELKGGEASLTFRNSDGREHAIRCAVAGDMQGVESVSLTVEMAEDLAFAVGRHLICESATQPAREQGGRGA